MRFFIPIAQFIVDELTIKSKSLTCCLRSYISCMRRLMRSSTTVLDDLQSAGEAKGARTVAAPPSTTILSPSSRTATRRARRASSRRSLFSWVVAIQSSTFLAQ